MNEKMRKALITGITGQDGAYLAQFLVEKGYKVYGAYRRTSSENFWRIEYLGFQDDSNLEFIELDITDQSNIIRIISKHEIDEIYNLAAQSFVGVSFEQPIMTSLTTGLGVTHLLEAVRIVNPKIRFYQASTSEMFGKVQEIPQKESTPFYPRSPYGVAKLYAHWMTVNYRESYDIFGCSGILFNHESPLRGKEFVTRKITDSVAKIHLGLQSSIELGNLDAKRDWGFAKEYVEGMFLILQQNKPDDYVLATGVNSTVRNFVSLAFGEIGIDVEWHGKKEKEVGVNAVSGEKVVTINPKFYRPAEVELLIGNATKAKEKLNWQATTDLKNLAGIMVRSDIKRNQDGASF